ncbi:MAG: glucosamine-6-phosphate isomerase, partial [Fidelibacterota bacterium]
EWSAHNPEGVISLPTGKTPEYFIKWVQYLRNNWNRKDLVQLRNDHGLSLSTFPDLTGLKFVQIDEFYPIDPSQHNSFYNYVQHFYIEGFGLNKQKAIFINCEEIPRPVDAPLQTIFPDFNVGLSLRYRDVHSHREQLQKKAIFMVDQWCSEYEQKIRDLGGIGFFLGGIGPDGHIAFNIRGSDHHSTTRLTRTNFETQAAAATDLGGIEISRHRLVITIGLATIVYNPEAVAVIIAAGEAKAKIIKPSLESDPDIRYPATVLQSLPQARFFLTEGAACHLADSERLEFKTENWDENKSGKVFVRVCRALHRFGPKVTPEELRSDPLAKHIPGLNEETIPQLLDGFKKKIDRGLAVEENQVFYHTGPHHDDIMLGFLPHITHLVRSASNRHYFFNMTSGFTSVTNEYVMAVLRDTLTFLDAGRIEMVNYPDFFERGYREKTDKDVYHYLDRIAQNKPEGRRRGLSHRLVRNLVEIYDLTSVGQLREKIVEVRDYLQGCYPGEKNRPDVQRLKGMIREFEEELVWAHFGIKVNHVHHLRLGFYTGDIFTEQPDRTRDVSPILESLKAVNPTVISLAFDPEGSGPDTHYKVLQAIAEAVREWSRSTDLSHLRIWGYRNVWYRFHPAEADIIVPVSLNSMAMLRDTFLTCYLSQKSASFPSYELDGPFCDLDQKIWVEQHQELELILGRDFWYRNEHPRIRASHGAVFLKEMSVDQFLSEARRLEKSMESQVIPGA